MALSSSVAFVVPLGGSCVGWVNDAVGNGTRRRPSTSVSTVVMRSGKARFQRPQQPLGQNRPGMPELPEDGTPVFALFVRSTTAKIWYPIGALRGDDRAKGLVRATQTQWGKRMYTNALDKGVARTVFMDGGKLLQSVFRQYPQLKKNRDVLEYGYKVYAKGMETPATTTVLTKEMAMNFFEWVKFKLGML